MRPAEDYVTLTEAAALAGLSPARLRALISRRVFREGVHFTRPQGIRLRIVRSALEEWLAGGAYVPTPTRRISRLAPGLFEALGLADQVLPAVRVTLRSTGEDQMGQRIPNTPELAATVRETAQRRGLDVVDLLLAEHVVTNRELDEHHMRAALIYGFAYLPGDRTADARGRSTGSDQRQAVRQAWRRLARQFPVALERALHLPGSRLRAHLECEAPDVLRQLAR